MPATKILSKCLSQMLKGSLLNKVTTTGDVN